MIVIKQILDAFHSRRCRRCGHKGNEPHDCRPLADDKSRDEYSTDGPARPRRKDRKD